MSGPKTSDFELQERARRELERKQQEELRRREEQQRRLEEIQRYEQEKERQRQEQRRQEEEKRGKIAVMDAGFEEGFGLSFSGTEVPREAPAPDAPAEDGNQREQVCQVLEELSGLPLPAPMKQKLNNLTAEAARMTDSFSLKNYYQAIVAPFARECRKYAEIRRRHDDLLIRCRILAEACETEVLPAEVSEEGIVFLEEQIRMLTAQDLKRREKEYIDQTVDEVMREMGYELIGDRTSVKKSGKKTKHQLYSLKDGTAVDVTYGANGQISMELGGIDFTDRKPDAAESAQLVEDMRHFCTDYEKLSRRLAERGIRVKNQSLLPPTEEYAQIINAGDYQMKKSVSRYTVQTRKKAARAQQRRGN